MMNQHELQARAAEHIKFSVDASLLRELGERLVGRAFIALAELIKNSYDADATEVVVTFEHDRIEVSDNGDGMSHDDFVNFWMRIGTPHKQNRIRGHRARPLTGSKGVGRLSAQFLAGKLEVKSVSEGSEEINVTVDWNAAVRAPELVQAEALMRTVVPPQTKFPAACSHGTTLILTQLRHEWSPSDFRDLAGEIWWLQPPFEEDADFRVKLNSPVSGAIAEFDEQMRAVLDIWHARLRGRIVRSKGEARVELLVEFAGDKVPTKVVYEVGSGIHQLEFEVRVFKLERRQPKGIRVGRAREYMNEYGGVHLYDAGFHLPFYGQQTDWLQIEFDWSHRLSRSKLLPANLQVRRGLLFLPGNARLLGAVRIDTALERRESEHDPQQVEPLTITVTRDRLLDNPAYRLLVETVRWAIDYYAMEEARREYAEAERRKPVRPPSGRLDEVRVLIDKLSQFVPPAEIEELEAVVAGVARDLSTEESLRSRQSILLGALATAGMTSLAYEHETSKQVAALEGAVSRARALDLSQADAQAEIAELLLTIERWVVRARETRHLFSNLLVAENREEWSRFRARPTIEALVDQIRPLLLGLQVDTGLVAPELLLPPATQAAWGALFQNVLINAANAMEDSPDRVVAIRSGKAGKLKWILVEDKGAGIDLAHAESLFEPFARGIQVSPERQALGLGGSGLGLTIVRIIAESAGCKVDFIRPDPGFATSFRLRWEEK